MFRYLIFNNDDLKILSLSLTKSVVDNYYWTDGVHETQLKPI